jgi:hypothetical protein
VLYDDSVIHPPRGSKSTTTGAKDQGSRQNQRTRIKTDPSSYVLEQRSCILFSSFSRNLENVLLLEIYLLPPNLVSKRCSSLRTMSAFGTISLRSLTLPKANLNARNQNGFSAVQLAARNGQLEPVEELIHIGVDVNIQCPWWRRNAEYVCRECDFIPGSFHGLSRKTECTDVRTAVQDAVAGGHLEILDRFMKAGATMEMTSDQPRERHFCHHGYNRQVLP